MLGKYDPQYFRQFKSSRMGKTIFVHSQFNVYFDLKWNGHTLRGDKSCQNVFVPFQKGVHSKIYFLLEQTSFQKANSKSQKLSNLVKLTRKHAYIILTPFNPTFTYSKTGVTGIYIIFLISAQKHRLWVLVRTASPRRF